MKVQKIQLDEERKIIINLIMNTQYCKEILPIVHPSYWATNYARTVSGWIESYYEEFKVAPEKNIRSIYQNKKSFVEDDEEQDEISTFLHSISKQYENLEINNIDYEIKNGIEYLGLRSLEVAKEAIDDAILNKDKDKGEAVIANYKRVNKPLGNGISLLHDAEKITEILTSEDDIMFTFPGALGQVAGPACRGDFISFLAPQKRGKSWWLWYSSELPMIYGHKVVLFSLEMPEKSVIKRSWRSLVGQPIKDKLIKYPRFENNEDGTFSIDIEEIEKKGIDVSQVEYYQKKFKRRFRRGDIRIISRVGQLTSVSDIDNELDNLEHYENFIADVIVIDYLDLLIPEKGFKGEYRHQLDNIWKGARRLAEKRNCVVITASQTEKGTFGKDISEGSASEDIRKISHITCGLALNQTKEERKNGIMRVAQVVTREGETSYDQAVVLQCLDIGRPCIDSRLRNEVILKKDAEDDKKDGYERKKRD
jgi:hypothetical protein